MKRTSCALDCTILASPTGTLAIADQCSGLAVAKQFASDTLI